MPTPQRFATGLVAVEIVGLWATAVFFFVARAPLLGGFFLMWAVVGSLVMWGLVRRKAAARAPAIVLQLLVIAAGAQAIATGGWPLGVGLIAAGGAAAVLLLNPVRV